MQFRTLFILLLAMCQFNESKAQFTGLYGMDSTQSLANYDFLYTLAPGANGKIWMGGRLEKTLSSSGGQVSEYGSLVELSPSGTILSSRKSGFRTIKAMKVASDNNLLLAGEGSGFMCTSGMCKTDLLVAKVTPLGILVWGRSFGNPNYNGSDGFRSIMETSDGNVVAVGNIYQSSLNSHPFVAKLNGQNGDTIWTKALGFPSNQFGNHAAEGPSGEIFIASSGDLRVVKLTSTGTVSWARAFASYGEVVRLEAQQDGSVIASGHYLAASGNYNICLFKVSGAGNLEWFHDYNTSLPDHYEFMNTMTAIQGGGYVIGGWHYSNINYAGTIPFLMKVDGNGMVSWARSWTDPVGKVTALLMSNGNLLAGIDHRNGVTSNQPDIALITLDTSGSGSCFIPHPVVQASPVITQVNSAAYFYGDYETQSTFVGFSSQLFWEKTFCATSTFIFENEINPFAISVRNNQLYVTALTEGKYQLELLDLSGRTLHSSLQKGDTVMELTGRSRSVYIIKIFDEKQIHSYRIVL